MPSTTRSWISFHLACADRRRGFLVQNHQRAAQRHARRQQAGQQPREIFQFLRGNFVRFELEGNFPEVFQPGRQAGAVFEPTVAPAFSARFTGRRPSVSICRSASGRPGASSCALGHLAVGLQCFVVKSGHWLNRSSLSRGQAGTLRRRIRRSISTFALDWSSRHFLGGGHAQNFLDRGDALADEPPAVLGQHLHARLARGVANLVGRGVFQNRAGGFPRRCPSTRKWRAGRKIRCCGIRGSRRICKSSCSPGMPSFALNACAVGELSGCLQCGQSTRTRRCASTASSDDATRYGSTPMSTSRVTAPGASLVCSVEKTRWPVSEACTAICAVSWSRISPISTTSGSWRKIERSPRAKVRPDFSLT